MSYLNKVRLIAQEFLLRLLYIFLGYVYSSYFTLYYIIFILSLLLLFIVLYRFIILVSNQNFSEIIMTNAFM